MEKILAPIPGKIISIAVKEGQNVKAGQLVLCLEAMKMQNDVYCDEGGVVKEVMVQVGENVSPNQLIIVLE